MLIYRNVIWRCYTVGEEYIKQGMERDRRPPFPGSESCDPCCEPPGKDRGGRPKEVRKDCGCGDPCRPDPCCDPCRPDPCIDPCRPEPCREDEWDWGSWLPIILVILLLCGGGGFFGGGGRDECCDGGGFGGLGGGWGGSSSWIIILVIVFLFCTNKEGGGRGGFLGGLF